MHLILYQLPKFQATQKHYQEKKAESVLQQGKPKIATSTPEKLILEQKAKEKLEKLEKQKMGRKKKACKKKTKTAHPVEESFSEDEDEPQLILESDVESETFSDLEPEKDFEPDLNFGKSDFCITKFKLEDKTGIKHYVGQILEVDGYQYKMNFMRKVNVCVNKFVCLEKQDIAWIGEKKTHCHKSSTNTSRNNIQTKANVKFHH